MYIYIYICICIYVYVCIYVCIYVCMYLCIYVSMYLCMYPPSPKIQGDFSFFKFGQRGGSLKNCSERRGFVKGVGVLFESVWGFQIVSSFFLKETCSHYYWNTFFFLVNIRTCCNQ